MTGEKQERNPISPKFPLPLLKPHISFSSGGRYARQRMDLAELKSPVSQKARTHFCDYFSLFLFLVVISQSSILLGLTSLTAHFFFF